MMAGRPSLLVRGVMNDGGERVPDGVPDQHEGRRGRIVLSRRRLPTPANDGIDLAVVDANGEVVADADVGMRYGRLARPIASQWHNRATVR